MFRAAFRVVLRIATITSVLAASSQSAVGQYTWDANGTGAGQTNGAGAWLGTNLWWNGSTNVTWVSGTDAVFGGPATAGGAVTLASPTTVGSLTFNTFTGTYTLGTAGQMITLNSGIMKNAGSAAVTFLSPITLGGDQTWTNNSTGLLTTGNGTNLIDNSGFQLMVDGTGNTNFGVINSLTAVLTGSGNLVKSGSGVLAVGGNNSGFTGNVTINGGVLRMTNDTGGLGSGNITLNGGVLEVYWGLGMTRNLGTGANEIRITGGSSGFSQNGNGQTYSLTFNNNSSFELVWGGSLFNPSTFVLAADTAQGSATTTLTNRVDLNGADRAFHVSGGTTGAARAIVSGQIRNSTGTAGITKTGAGVLSFTNASNAWNGSTTINGGILDVGGMTNANLGGGSGRNITIAAGAGIRFNALSNTFLNRIVETTDEIAVMTGTTNNNLDFSSSTGANLPNAFLGNWASNGAKAEYSGTLTPASDNYRLGSPTANSGLLGITNNAPMTGSRGLIIGGGSVELVGAKTFSGDTVIRNGARLGLAAFTGGSTALGLQNSVLDTGTGSSTGTIWFESGSASGPITGSTATTSAVFGGLKGSRNLFSVYSTTTGANNSAATAVTAITGFTLNLGPGVTATYSGAIGGFGTGASGSTGGAATLTVMGSGTQVFTGTSTYTGTTSITGGTLEIAGSGAINGTSGVTINGGTLRYNSSTNLTSAVTFTSGTVAGTNWNGSLSGLTVGSNQTISPGNSPGSATTTSQTWAGGGTYIFELNQVTSTGGDQSSLRGQNPGHDTINISGTLNITADSGNKFTIDIRGLNGSSPGAVTNWDNTKTYTWIIAGAGSVTGFDVNSFNLNTTNFVDNNSVGTGEFSIGQVGNNIVLTFTPVPEPHHTLLLATGALFAVMILRRRNRAVATDVGM